jgi:Ca2+-binding RTX toxin-like protein
MFGGAHGDRLFGDLGSDRAVGGAGNGRIDGGAASDTLDARDGPAYIDRLACGVDRDTALTDPGDVMTGDRLRTGAHEPRSHRHHPVQGHDGSAGAAFPVEQCVAEFEARA